MAEALSGNIVIRISAITGQEDAAAKSSLGDENALIIWFIKHLLNAAVCIHGLGRRD